MGDGSELTSKVGNFGLPTSFIRKDPALRSLGLGNSSRNLRFFGAFRIGKALQDSLSTPLFLCLRSSKICQGVPSSAKIF